MRGNSLTGIDLGITWENPVPGIMSGAGTPLSARAKGKLKRLEAATRAAIVSPPTIRRARDDVPPVPEDGIRYDHPRGGHTIDKDLMRWRFDWRGEMTAWFLYRSEEDRAAGIFPWAETWSDGKS